MGTDKREIVAYDGKYPVYLTTKMKQWRDNINRASAKVNATIPGTEQYKQAYAEYIAALCK